MTTVITGWGPAGYELYAKRFLETFDQFWPESVKLQCYVERAKGVSKDRCRLLWKCNGVAEFIERHENDAQARGMVKRSSWSLKETEAGYSYRFDAVKFCRQGFIPEDAALALPDGEILAWLDADVVTFKMIPENFIDRLLGTDELVHLGREGTHSEIGFWAVRLNPMTRKFLEMFARAYRDDAVFGLKEWHSAYVFDFCRMEMAARGMRVKNLSPGGKGHVWFQTELGKYTDHLKGDRKKIGRSKERAA